MSWSVSFVGRGAAVAAKLKEALDKQKCSEPEETIKNKVGEALILATSSLPEGGAVTVTASGSQYMPDHTKPDKVYNTLSVSLNTLYGFVE